ICDAWGCCAAAAHNWRPTIVWPNFCFASLEVVFSASQPSSLPLPVRSQPTAAPFMPPSSHSFSPSTCTHNDQCARQERVRVRFNHLLFVIFCFLMFFITAILFYAFFFMNLMHLL